MPAELKFTRHGSRGFANILTRYARIAERENRRSHMFGICTRRGVSRYTALRAFMHERAIIAIIEIRRDVRT